MIDLNYKFYFMFHVMNSKYKNKSFKYLDKKRFSSLQILNEVVFKACMMFSSSLLVIIPLKLLHTTLQISQ